MGTFGIFQHLSFAIRARLSEESLPAGIGSNRVVGAIATFIAGMLFEI